LAVPPRFDIDGSVLASCATATSLVRPHRGERASPSGRACTPPLTATMIRLIEARTRLPVSTWGKKKRSRARGEYPAPRRPSCKAPMVNHGAGGATVTAPPLCRGSPASLEDRLRRSGRHGPLRVFMSFPRAGGPARRRAVVVVSLRADADRFLGSGSEEGELRFRTSRHDAHGAPACRQIRGGGGLLGGACLENGRLYRILGVQGEQGEQGGRSGEGAARSFAVRTTFGHTSQLQ
jgi:hypothetical protein